MDYRILIICVVVLVFSCAERNKVNPFDSTGDIYLALQITSTDQKVELSWATPQVEGFTGFNVYRKMVDYDKAFVRIAADLSPGTRKFTDTDIAYEQTYIYYLTISGHDVESRPSESVHISPGPGQVWIVDKWGYQIVKTTYDLQHRILLYETDWPPVNMAISKELGTGIILYQSFNVLDKIDLSGKKIGQYDQIEHPVDIAYDRVDSLFWIVDSSGYLYSLDPKTDRIAQVSQSLSNPVRLSIAPEINLINVIDRTTNRIVQFNRFGNIVNTISRINGKELKEPVRYIIDERSGRNWMVDRQEEIDYIYTRDTDASTFSLLDSVYYSGDLEVNRLDQTGWLISYNAQNSAVVQLSASGSRQLELSGFYNPYDIEINGYDGSLLVADSGHSKVIHYNLDYVIIGETSGLEFPVKIIVE